MVNLSPPQWFTMNEEWIKNSALATAALFLLFKDTFSKIYFCRFLLVELPCLLFSPCYWSSLLSCSFTHIHKFPLPHPRGSFAQSQPELLIFWQLFGKRAWATYTIYSIHAVTIYLGGLFWRETHCKIITSAEMETQKTAHNYTHPPWADSHWNAAYSAIL